MVSKQNKKKSKVKFNNDQKDESNKDLTKEDDAYDAIFGGEFGSLEIGSYIRNDSNDDGATQHLPDAVDFEDEDELADEEELSQADDDNKGTAVNKSHASILPNDNMNLSLNDMDPNGNMMNEAVAFGNGVQDGNEFMLSHDGSPILPNNLNEFESGNNALFMGIDDTNGNAVFVEQQTSYDMFSMANNNQPQISKQDEKIRSANREKALLKYYFPDFKKGDNVRWNRSIYRKSKRYNYHIETDFIPLKPLIPSKLKLQVQQDQKKIFRTMDHITTIQALQKKKKKHSIITATLDELYPLIDEKSNEKTNLNENNKISEDLLVATDDWDEEKIINGEKSIERNTDTLLSTKVDDINSDAWNWNEDNLVDAKLSEAKHAELDMNDEKLLLLIQREPVHKDVQPISVNLPFDHMFSGPQLSEKLLLSKFNISNDEIYSTLKRTHQPKVRSTISNLNIEHSQPAINLQSPFYKVVLPRNQLRFYHRPKFGSNIRPNTTFFFNKLKTRKRKRDKGKDVRESFTSTADLTIGDTAPIYLMEYSEQDPLALSKFGMANKLINYYRKYNEQDTLRPKLPVGETHVLGVQDKSPFWNFGFVEPGHIVPTLYNNMVRAPVFKHGVSGTDFLLVRSTGNGTNNKFYLRNINHLFTVGQTFPVEEIPGPNSRKVTSMRTTRLKMIVYRILNRTPNRAISIEPITRHFPDQDYGQNRQKIKEFMKYQREGPDKGLWKLKEGEVLLDNENTKKLLLPEQVAEVESMSHGLQFWEDNENYNFDEKLLKLEENLLPWNVTKNFVNATQMRAMIQIHGAGDPTGCGEGFSFLKTSMKGGFVKSESAGPEEKRKKKRNASVEKNGNSTGHTYNVVQQQKAYEEEISKTWYTHTKSLSVTNPFEEIDDPNVINQTNKKVRTHRDDNKVLKIVRKRRDENGIIQRQTIIIKDPRVIKGYIRGKERMKEAKLDVNKLLEDDNLNLENVEDIEMQKKLLQNELASLEKSQQRRAARQMITANKKKMQEQQNPDGSASPGKVTKSKNTTRRCATCGQIGHIRTNKSCPMYNAANNAANEDNSTNATNSPAAVTTPIVHNSSEVQ
ncbi:hypothetical protein KAFR_0I02540 [Kazachstania africana CBS 2517]|uniref:Transcription initiation factor TFIID subunit 1 histone acetyltransferase domain-containing protein n=1 Tax=Kazachstania africana (strain ATCC 22294 / BCRC 22015 / CBS 2517 / CECT 1963 / NBRC 1671 / NRRL Y-8276) TaxID=1071382 RepID=H2B083_KAZAF|nr:hypothetical protein KAFR_0I02540 [Kazachstania africana CBS 2517]CCF60033.1 hypothetical protein KAFR_0I02540 [Kazachstania africana CBS 2517]